MSTAHCEIPDFELIRLSKQSKAFFDEACTILLKRHSRLIKHTANKHGNPAIPIDDRISVCQFGFCESIRLHDESKSTGLSITTYAMWKMRAELKALNLELFPYLNQPETNAIPQECDIDKEYEYIFEDFEDSRITNPMKELIQKEAIAILRRALTSISERNRFIYTHMLGLFGDDEMDGKELAEYFGISHQRIYEIFELVNLEVMNQIQDTYRINDWSEKAKQRTVRRN